MRGWIVVLAVTAGCASNDDSGGDDGTNDDTDGTAPDDTDLPGDTDDTEDTDTPPPDDAECLPFAACGGDVVGTWSFDDMCFPDFPNPFTAICATSDYIVDMQVDGTSDVVADETFTLDFDAVTVSTFTFPGECNDGIDSCSTYAAITGAPSCTGDPAVMCTCVYATDPSHQSEGGQWHYDGDDVVFQDLVAGAARGAAGEVTMHYCQDGDAMTLKYKAIDLQLDFSR